jgi:hypothetical protein
VKIVKNIVRKFIDSLSIDDYLVETDTGWEEISQINKTVKYDTWYIKTNKNKSLKGADNHILFDEFYNEKFIKEFKPGDKIITKDGIEVVNKVVDLNKKNNMYDLSVKSKNHRYYSNEILSHNSTVLSIFLAWYSCFHNDKTSAIAANKESVAKEIFKKSLTIFENLPHFLKPGVIELSKTLIEFDNGSRALASATSESGISGYAIQNLILDEVGLINSELFDAFYSSMEPTVSADPNGKITMISTPKGMNHWYYIWQDALKGKSGFHAFKVEWDEVPGRDEKWKKQKIKEVGEEIFKQEYCCAFTSQSGALLTADEIETLDFCAPIKVSNDGFYKQYKEPEEDHVYVMAVDVAQGVGRDYSVAVVLDVSEDKIEEAAMWRSNTVSQIDLPFILQRIGDEYNEALIVIENNLGAITCDYLFNQLEYNQLYTTEKDVGLRMNPAVRKQGVERLKDLVVNKGIIIHSEQFRIEISTFVKTKTKFEASSGCHDDVVMAFVIFSYFAGTEWFKEYAEQDHFQNLHSHKLKKMLIEDMALMAYSDNPDVLEYSRKQENDGDIIEEKQTLDWENFGIYSG